MRLFHHPDGGYYAADSLDEARRLLAKDVGGDESDANAQDMEALPDDKPLTVWEGETEDTMASETKTAKEWADSAMQKGYQFGGVE